MATMLESLPKIGEIEELIVPIRGVVGGEFLVIDAQGIAHLMEKAGDSVGTDADAEVANAKATLAVVRRDHLRPVMGSPAVSYSSKNSIRVMMSEVFFRLACVRRRNGGCAPAPHSDRAAADGRELRCADPGRGSRPESCRRRGPV